MDTTLRYVQQFGRSKRDNLKPSLTAKYHVGQEIEVWPFRIMDFGCFAATTDGLSGLLHNSEMSNTLQQNLPELIEKAHSLTVRISKYDRRTGEVAFALESKDKEKDKDATETTAPVVLDPAAIAASNEVTTNDTVTSAVKTTTVITTTVSTEPSDETHPDLEPFQFSTSQPVFPEPKPALNEAAYSEFLDKEIVDIQKFLESVIKSDLSPAARTMLKELLTKTSIFRFTYTMQTVVDEFEPDVGLQLVSLISRKLDA